MQQLSRSKRTPARAGRHPEKREELSGRQVGAARDFEVAVSSFPLVE